MDPKAPQMGHSAVLETQQGPEEPMEQWAKQRQEEESRRRKQSLLSGHGGSPGPEAPSSPQPVKERKHLLLAELPETPRKKVVQCCAVVHVRAALRRRNIWRRTARD